MNSPSLTPYHAAYFAQELTKRGPADSVQKLAATLVDAKVDLNPHQVEAALFAFRSPLSKGAILADEVGLGKTIEAGLVLAQKWAERKRHLLVICPANLRKQWSQELADKFYLPSVILEAQSFNAAFRAGRSNPFEMPVGEEAVVICSYEFAAARATDVRRASWDLAILDEAHRLRNVYQSGESRSRRAKAVQLAVAGAPKLLLTATPLQNSLLELYGLVSIVDEHVFGDLKSFKQQFGRVGVAGAATDAATFTALKNRLAPICQRTLRRQVLEYIRYTGRKALVERFYPTPAEQELYDGVTTYLQRDMLHALPPAQRKLMTLVLRRLLASSSFAVAGTFDTLASRLEERLRRAEATQELTPAAEAVADPAALLEPLFGDYANLREEWDDDEDEAPERTLLTPGERAEAAEEVVLLRSFETLANSIRQNSKGEKLLTALQQAFEVATAEDATGRRAARKAIIFTESTRTQKYLLELLEANGYRGQIVLFNGSNADAGSRQIYEAWVRRYRGTDRASGSRSADTRAALVDYFRDEATIMLATEAAAEGINLQFCSLVVNYDLPWNPQRIEQRIGRCHRYGQLFDVVVLNFLNTANAADVRVYELLNERFKLFDGVFGASDEVLGAIESGVDFEQRIARIYQQCATPAQIETAFASLKQDLETQITATMQRTRQQLLEHFDEEVHEKLRVNLAASRQFQDQYERWLWDLTRYGLRTAATFAPAPACAFTLHTAPTNAVSVGTYQFGAATTTITGSAPAAHQYRLGHPLAQHLLREALTSVLPPATLTFDYSGAGRQVAVLAALVGQMGWLTLHRLTLETPDGADDTLLLLGFTDAGEPLDSDAGRRLFSLHASVVLISPASPEAAAPVAMSAALDSEKARVLHAAQVRQATAFDTEMGKLDAWADDLKVGLERELRDLDAEIKLLRADARRTPDLAPKLEMQRRVKKLEAERHTKRARLFQAQDEVDQRKEALLSEVEARLHQHVTLTEVLTVRWVVV